MTAITLADRWARLGTLLRARAGLLGQVGWVSGSFAASQSLRLVTNIMLAWLLNPALLGTMTLINTLRTGGELLSDVGIRQSIVNNRRGAEPVFLHTAWTLQIVRGFVLFGLAWAGSAAIAGLYDDPQLRTLLPVAAVVFVISGFVSPARHVLQKTMHVKRLALFDLSMTVTSFTIHVVLALISPTIWALIGGLLLSTLVTTVGSFFLMRGMSHELRLDRTAAREILHFGKWIFFASLVYFLAMNFDRLYLADAVPFALLGVYGIARTFSETIRQVFARLGSMLIFPRVSASDLRGNQLREKVAPMRWWVVLGAAVALASVTSVADLFITIVYDERYAAAGIFLTILMAGTWFAMLGTLSDAIVMGLGKPSTIATSNVAKLCIIAAALPLALPKFGFTLALFVLVAAEAVRYGMLMLRQRTLGLGFTRQDIIATALFVAVALILRELTGLIGLTSGLEGWIEAVRAADTTHA